MSHPIKEPPKAESLSLKDEAALSRSSSVPISLLLSSCVELSGITIPNDKSESCGEGIRSSGGVGNDCRCAEVLARGGELGITSFNVELMLPKGVASY